MAKAKKAKGTAAKARIPSRTTHITRPQYGEVIGAAAGDFDDEDEYYDEEDEEGLELEEALARVEEYENEDDYDDFGMVSGDMWPAEVPNRLAPRVDAVTKVGEKVSEDQYRASQLGLPLALPYEVESLSSMDERLELICCKLVECVKGREFGAAFRLWDSALGLWCSVGYPMKKDMRIKLIFLYYEIICVATSLIDDAGNQFIGLIGHRDLQIFDFRIPWKPLYEALYQELFPHPQKLARHTVNLANMYLNVAEAAQRFFHPGDVDEMLDTILPKLEPSMDSILATQTFLVHFLPITHCQKWLPLVFRLWTGLNSGFWDDQASDLMGQLSITHINPRRSDPTLIDEIPRNTFNTAEEEANNKSHKRLARLFRARQLEVAGDVIVDDDGVTHWCDEAKLGPEPEYGSSDWQGIRKDVGIFTEQQFEFLMSKCLRSLNVPVGGSIASQNAASLTAADARVSKKIIEAKKPIDRVQSLAEVIIYCMAEDAPMAPTSETPGSVTPMKRTATPLQPAIARLQNGTSMTRTGSADSLAAAGKKSEENRTYLAGSKAMDHLSRLLTSCETFFHPSNSGHWSMFLTAFLSHLAGNFVERWKEEEQPSCKTPPAWRLTPAIKRAFVLCLRPLALTSMFMKDMECVQPAVGTLRRLTLLEPDLIMPAIMERVTPSLQGLEETQRTPAVTFAVAALSQGLASRQIWRIGGLYIPDIFTLLLPGIDLNDPSKTGLSCMAISNIVDFIRIGDISEIDETNDAPRARALRLKNRPLPQDDPNDPMQGELEDLTPEEVNSRVRFATAAFRNWVPDFIERVLLLFANLPEEGGKSGRAGGKVEMMTLQSVLHTCGAVFAALDDKMFDVAMEQVVEYATTTIRANAVDAVGELVRNLTASRGNKVFARLFPIAKQRIMGELKAGASSVRTTTTLVPLPGDAALHWWLSILLGMLLPGRVTLSEPNVRAEFIELLHFMVQHTFSERGYSWTGKILEKSMGCLTSIYFEEMNNLDPTIMKSKDLAENHTLYWGKMYRPVEVKPQWRTPSDNDISMAFDILAIADEAAKRLNELMGHRQVGDKVWSNDFCRSINAVDKILRGSYNLWLEHADRKKGAEIAPPIFPPELIELLPPYKSGMILDDPKDPRYLHVEAFRQRIGETLHSVANAMRDAGQSDNSVETVKLLVTTIGTYMTAYGIKHKQYTGAQTALSSMNTNKRIFDGQKKHHRSIMMASLSVHHQNRQTMPTYYRQRSALDDKLIRNMLDFCLSPFVRVRRSAQSILDSMARVYRGMWTLCIPTLFNALQPGTDPDVMKGALYVLRYNQVGIVRLSRDWRPGQLVDLALNLLNAHHENKASVQALVAKAMDELISAMREPVTFNLDVGLSGLDRAANDLLQSIRGAKPDAKLVGQIKEWRKKQLDTQNEQVDVFTQKVLAVAEDPSLNWRYTLFASRLLFQVLRRDRPTDTRLATHFVTKVLNPHPRIRDFAVVGMTRILFNMTIRTMCQGSEERMFLEEPVDPFSSTIELINTSREFTEEYLASFRQPLPATNAEAVHLQDSLDTGWLVWGKTMEVSRVPAMDEPPLQMLADEQDAVKIIRGVMDAEGFWQQVAEQWQQEETRNYPSATHIDFVLGYAQAFGNGTFHALKPIIEAYLTEMESTKVYDRHKTRAMWEFLAGLMRGSEEWPRAHTIELWDWLSARLPDLFGNIRHDTTKCWDISIEYVLNDRDPRRFQPLVDFCLSTAKSADFTSSSAFDLARRVQLVRSVLRCLQWRFNAWADEFIDLYFRSITCPYAEVRGLMASVLNGIDQIKFYPSYPSAKALTDDILSDPEGDKDIMHIRTGLFAPQLQKIMEELPRWKAERPHGPKAVLSDHDTAASTTLSWLSVELSDVHAAATFPYIIPILGEIFELRELNDNNDLQRIAGRLLAMITSITPDFTLIEPLMNTLISILQKSESWRTRMHTMPVLSLVYFRNLALLSEPLKAKCLDIVSTCLRDPNQEVREMAAMTLSGFLRCSQRSMVVVLKDRFSREIQSTTLPRRTKSPGQVDPNYVVALVKLHGAILGATALVDAFPYTVPKFIPKLLADVLAPRVSDPAPVSTAIRTCVASFKRTHEKYQDKFSEDELSAMNYAQAGNSYYA